MDAISAARIMPNRQRSLAIHLGRSLSSPAMPAAARHVRALVLIVTALMAAGGESLALPVAHLFADHHHEINFSPASGNWQWVAVADHHHESATLSAPRQGHDHQIREVAVPFRSSNQAGLSLAMIPVAVIDDRGAGSPARRGDSPDSPPDVGKPDLALLATMRV